MSFPTSSTLDSFARGNSLTLGANWSPTPIYKDTGTVGVTSTEALPNDNDAGAAGSVWLPNSFTGAVETWGIARGVDGHPAVYACFANEDSDAGPRGYALTLKTSGDTFLSLVRLDGASGEGLDIGDSSITLGADSIGFGMVIDSGTITAYASTDGGATWTACGSPVSDATYDSGDIAFGWEDLSGAASAFTAFGGGGTTDGSGGGTIGDRPTVKRFAGGLTLQVVDLAGAAIVDGAGGRPLPVTTVDQPQVSIPLSDSRTGQIAVSMYEGPIAQVIAHGAATAVVKVLYTNPKGITSLLLNGIVMNPESDFDAGTVTATLHDHTIRLKKRALGYNHESIMLGIGQTIDDANVNDYTGGSFNGVNSVYGIPLDGAGVRLLLYDAAHGTSDRPAGGTFAGVPSMGIRPGTDSANRQPLYDDNGVPPLGVVGFTATATEGDATLTDVDFSGATWTGGGAPDITDILANAVLDGPGIPTFATVVSASGTSIVMSLPATATHPHDGDGANAFATEPAVYCQLSRGDYVYDDLLELVQAQGAFEANFIPIDASHLGVTGDDWAAGQFIELHTDNRLGSDRSIHNTDGNVPVQFIHGIGGFHCVYSPDADDLVTYDVQVGPGGPADQLDLNSRVLFIGPTTDTYGMWEEWDQAVAAGTGDSPVGATVLADRAAATLTAYQHPPQFVTATIDRDSIGTYCFGSDFFIGDTVTVVAKKGHVSVNLDARIVNIGVSQIDENGACQLNLTMVPHLITGDGVAPDDL